MKTLKKILEYPPKKLVHCVWCSGSGIVNRRGWRQSDPCPKCCPGGDSSHQGKVYEIDYESWECQIKDFLRKEVNNAI